MSTLDPEALARLRTEAENRFHSVEIQAEDLRALLDAHTYLDQHNFTLQHSLREAQKSRDWHAAQTQVVDAMLTEALNALRGVLSSPGYADIAQIDRDRVLAVLAKAGRR